MATNPFIYGQVVTGTYFTNRAEEKKQLSANILNGIHTIIISPRRWGKSSLVEEVTNHLKHKKEIRTVKLDLSSIIDERDFYTRYAKAVLKATSSKTDEVLDSIKNAFKSIKPSISIESVDNSFSIGFNLTPQDSEKGFEDILNLPELLARRKKIKLCIALDEFQSIESFVNPSVFQGKLRSVMQHHKNVRYIFYGSRKHMMESIFKNKSAPFYNFGDIIWLNKISAEDFIPFIKTKFTRSGKQISEEQVETILELVDYNPQYVQLLANKVWESTTRKVTSSIISESVELVVGQFQTFYSTTFENLSKHQKSFLYALLDTESGSIFNQRFVEKNNLGSTANVNRIKQSLIKKDIIDFPDGKTPGFIDPGFRLWLLQSKK